MKRLDKDIKSENIVPGYNQSIQRYTDPSEIKSLGKYLKEGISKKNSEVELGEDNLGVPGTFPQDKPKLWKTEELSKTRINVMGSQEIVKNFGKGSIDESPSEIPQGLGDSLEPLKISESPINLGDRIEYLEEASRERTLENHLEGLSGESLRDLTLGEYQEKIEPLETPEMKMESLPLEGTAEVSKLPKESLGISETGAIERLSEVQMTIGEESKVSALLKNSVNLPESIRQKLLSLYGLESTVGLGEKPSEMSLGNTLEELPEGKGDEPLSDLDRTIMGLIDSSKDNSLGASMIPLESNKNSRALEDYQEKLLGGDTIQGLPDKVISGGLGEEVPLESKNLQIEPLEIQGLPDKIISGGLGEEVPLESKNLQIKSLEPQELPNKVISENPGEEVPLESKNLQIEPQEIQGLSDKIISGGLGEEIPLESKNLQIESPEPQGLSDKVISEDLGEKTPDLPKTRYDLESPKIELPETRHDIESLEVNLPDLRHDLEATEVELSETRKNLKETPEPSLSETLHEISSEELSELPDSLDNLSRGSEINLPETIHKIRSKEIELATAQQVKHNGVELEPTHEVGEKIPKISLEDSRQQLLVQEEPELSETKQELDEIPEVNLPSPRHDLEATEVELPETRHDIESLEVELPEIRHDLESLEVELPSLRHDLEPSEVELPEIRHDIESLEVNLPSLRHDLESSEVDLETKRLDIKGLSDEDLEDYLVKTQAPNSERSQGNNNYSDSLEDYLSELYGATEPPLGIKVIPRDPHSPKGESKYGPGETPGEGSNYIDGSLVKLDKLSGGDIKIEDSQEEELSGKRVPRPIPGTDTKRFDLDPTLSENPGISKYSQSDETDLEGGRTNFVGGSNIILNRNDSGKLKVPDASAGNITDRTYRDLNNVRPDGEQKVNYGGVERGHQDNNNFINGTLGDGSIGIPKITSGKEITSTNESGYTRDNYNSLIENLDHFTQETEAAMTNFSALGEWGSYMASQLRGILGYDGTYIPPEKLQDFTLRASLADYWLSEEKKKTRDQEGSTSSSNFSPKDSLKDGKVISRPDHNRFGKEVTFWPEVDPGGKKKYPGISKYSQDDEKDSEGGKTNFIGDSRVTTKREDTAKLKVPNSSTGNITDRTYRDLNSVKSEKDMKANYGGVERGHQDNNNFINRTLGDSIKSLSEETKASIGIPKNGVGKERTIRDLNSQKDEGDRSSVFGGLDDKEGSSNSSNFINKTIGDSIKDLSEKTKASIGIPENGVGKERTIRDLNSQKDEGDRSSVFGGLDDKEGSSNSSNFSSKLVKGAVSRPAPGTGEDMTVQDLDFVVRDNWSYKYDEENKDNGVNSAKNGSNFAPDESFKKYNKKSVGKQRLLISDQIEGVEWRSDNDNFIEEIPDLEGTPQKEIPPYKLPHALHDVGSWLGGSTLNLSTYIRWAVENTVGKLGKGEGIKGALKQTVLDEALALSILAREAAEYGIALTLDGSGNVGRITLSSGGRSAGRGGTPKAYHGLSGRLPGTVIPGGDLLQKSFKSGLSLSSLGTALAKASGLSEPLEDPKNRPTWDGESWTNPQERGVTTWKLRNEVTTFDNESGFGTTGFGVTAEEILQKKPSDPSLRVYENFLGALRTSEFTTTASRLVDWERDDRNILTLDSNHVWEIKLFPYIGAHNGKFSWLPAIGEINARNEAQFGYKSHWDKWIPFQSFEVMSSKISPKTASLYNGQIEFPQGVEFTNELRLSLIDDSYKSWKWYFERVMETSVYLSNVHDGKFYEKDPNGYSTSDTIVARNVQQVGHYKNLTFRCIIYCMNPQYLTVKKLDLLTVLKDFSEEWQGEADATSPDLNLTFSIVGENPKDNLPEIYKTQKRTAKDYYSKGDKMTTRNGGLTSIVGSGLNKVTSILS